ncbi:MAG: hypothetical protein ABI783_06135 [Actinomycetota bacterium]
MLSSSTESALSIVIGSNGAQDSVETCLAALEPQLDGDVEVIVCEPEASPGEVRRRFPSVRFLARKGALVPELWRDGIDEAQGELVALTISPMVPASDWVATARRLATGTDGLGGAIEPTDGLRVRDWAEYLCRYARDMLPFEAHDCLDLPGDNAVYRMAALELVRESYRDGFWEPVVHRELHARGGRLRHEPQLVVRQGRSAGIAAFARQRLRHGRMYGHQRGETFSSARNVVGVLGAPLVPFLMTFRVVRHVLEKRRRRLRTLVALPLIFYFNLVWAAAEAKGHLEVLTRSE